MTEVLSLVGYGVVAVFGIFLAAGFAGICVKKSTARKLLLFAAASLAVQFVVYYFNGVQFTQRIYPLILHLPLVLVLTMGYRKSWAVSTVSVFLAYLCCQIPKWVSSITYLFTEEPLYYHVLYIAVVSVTYAVLHKYAVASIQKLMNYSPKAAWGLGLLPLLYYVFDYVTTVYSDILYSGNPYVVQIMPSVMAVGYILFVMLYQSRVEEQETVNQERQLLYLQLRRSQTEYTALCQMQEQANRYHHDLRHHTSLLMDYAQKGSLTEIKAYLREMQQNLDVVTHKHFCGHPVVDLVLSHFESQAVKAGVCLSVSAELPVTLPFKDTELCSLLSNALENAIFAASQTEEQKVVSVSLSVRQRNLLLSVQNPCRDDVTIENGLPVAKRSGHGFGTRSIASIVNQYGGLVHFSAAGGVFLLRASLPMR